MEGSGKSKCRKKSGISVKARRNCMIVGEHGIHSVSNWGAMGGFCVGE